MKKKNLSHPCLLRSLLNQNRDQDQGQLQALEKDQDPEISILKYFY